MNRICEDCKCVAHRIYVNALGFKMNKCEKCFKKWQKKNKK